MQQINENQMHKTKFEEYKNMGLTGLTNLGNTCFMNTCIQILSHTYELNDFLKKTNYKNKLNNKYDSALLIEWDNLRNLMWSQNCVVSPAKFLKTVQKLSQIKKNDLFTGYDQNDISEFLLFVIDCFHNSLMREVDMTIVGNPSNNRDKVAIKCFEMIKRLYSKEYSEIFQLFYGVHISQIISLEKNEILSMNPEPFFMINLSIH